MNNPPVLRPQFEVRLEDTHPEVWVRPPNQAPQKVPALWLRTRSDDPDERDLGTRQRLTNPHLYDAAVQIKAAHIDGETLHVTFSDGLRTGFALSRLEDDVCMTDECPPTKAWEVSSWKSEQNPNAPFLSPHYDWKTLGQEDVFFRALVDFIQYGFLIVKNTPTESHSIIEVARRFGYPRETNFDVMFEVYSRPPEAGAHFSDDLAYRPVALGPHTDNPYRNPVPGIQLLQCLQNETSGGYSTLVDSLAVCAQLKQEDPEGYQLLVDTPLRFEYRGGSAELVNICPIIEQNGQGEMVGVHFSPRLCDLPLLDEATTQRLQRTLARLSVLFEDPRYELKFRLMPGEMMMFDNNRVLHGRTAFDPSEGHRQLQGCYIDRDAPRSHYRILKKRLRSH